MCILLVCLNCSISKKFTIHVDSYFLNKINVIDTLDEYLNNLTKFKEFMETDNFVDLFNEMENPNLIKEILNEMA